VVFDQNASFARSMTRLCCNAVVSKMTTKYSNSWH